MITMALLALALKASLLSNASIVAGAPSRSSSVSNSGETGKSSGPPVAFNRS